MTYILIAILCGINFFPLFSPELDIWHSQGIWTQVGILVLFSATFVRQPQFKEPKNIELGLLNLWIGLFTAYICYISQIKGQYDLVHFLPYFNFICLLILYKVVVQYLNKISIELCVKFLKYAIIANLVISVLQYFGASQFFQLFWPQDRFHNNPVNGFIGNGTHLSGFLAMMIPVFLYFGKREDYLCLLLMAIVLCLAGTSTGEPSISGWIVGAVIIAFWMFHVKRKWFWYGILGSVLSGIGLLLSGVIPLYFFGLSGREVFWMTYLPVVKKYFVTGAGLGALNYVYQDSALPNVRHLHMEYLQIILEVGIIGLAIVVAMIKRFFSFKTEDRLELCLKSIFLGFLVSACFNYPMHLWLPATYATFAYAAYLALKREVSYAS